MITLITDGFDNDPYREYRERYVALMTSAASVFRNSLKIGGRNG